MQTFTWDKLLISKDSPKLDYYRRKDEVKTSVHWGQRKLFISEILFLTFFHDPNKVPNPIILYVGAAPGTHIKYLSELFPECIFHLYDPAKFDSHLHNLNNVYIHQQFFTDEDAKTWANRNDVYFISDIRTANPETMGEQEVEQHINEDMDSQKRWYEIMRPVHAFLKFRLPWPDRWAAPLREYLYGYLFVQPWAPQTSTEGRLYPIKDNQGNPILFKWGNKDYESAMFYHNTVVRETVKFAPVPFDPPELLDDYDSIAEVFILRNFLAKKGLPYTDHNVRELSRRITAELNAHYPPNRWRTISNTRQKQIVVDDE